MLEMYFGCFLCFVIIMLSVTTSILLVEHMCLYLRQCTLLEFRQLDIGRDAKFLSDPHVHRDTYDIVEFIQEDYVQQNSASASVKNNLLVLQGRYR